MSTPLSHTCSHPYTHLSSLIHVSPPSSSLPLSRTHLFFLTHICSLLSRTHLISPLLTHLPPHTCRPSPSLSHTPVLPPDLRYLRHGGRREAGDGGGGGAAGTAGTGINATTGTAPPEDLLFEGEGEAGSVQEQVRVECLLEGEGVDGRR